MSLEEGKLNAMLEGVTSGSPWSNKTNKEKVSGVAKKVVQYLNMKKGGHYMYGMGFMFCQVLSTYNEPHIYINSLKRVIFTQSYFNGIIFQIFSGRFYSF